MRRGSHRDGQWKRPIHLRNRLPFHCVAPVDRNRLVAVGMERLISVGGDERETKQVAHKAAGFALCNVGIDPSHAFTGTGGDGRSHAGSARTGRSRFVAGRIRDARVSGGSDGTGLARRPAFRCRVRMPVRHCRPQFGSVRSHQAASSRSGAGNVTRYSVGLGREGMADHERVETRVRGTRYEHSPNRRFGTAYCRTRSEIPVQDKRRNSPVSIRARVTAEYSADTSIE